MLTALEQLMFGSFWFILVCHSCVAGVEETFQAMKRSRCFSLSKVIYSRFAKNRRPCNIPQHLFWFCWICLIPFNCLHLRYVGLNRIELEPALQQQENLIWHHTSVIFPDTSGVEIDCNYCVLMIQRSGFSMHPVPERSRLWNLLFGSHGDTWEIAKCRAPSFAPGLAQLCWMWAIYGKKMQKVKTRRTFSSMLQLDSVGSWCCLGCPRESWSEYGAPVHLYCWNPTLWVGGCSTYCSQIMPDLHLPLSPNLFEHTEFPLWSFSSCAASFQPDVLAIFGFIWHVGSCWIASKSVLQDCQL